jgi:O-acetylserine/cysteine efflux transporter
MTVALAGLAAIATTVGSTLTLAGLLLTLASPISFGIGNVLLKRQPPVDMLRLTVWLSLVPPLPALVLSIVLDGPRGFVTALAQASWIALLSAVYLGVAATTLGYALWGRLLRRYSAALVTPFALLVPFVAAGASAVVFDERFGGMRLLGMGLVLLGLAVIVLPLDRLVRRAPSTAVLQPR